MITTAKGLTNGIIPMGAVFVKKEIYDAFMSGPEHVIEFFHGYTYSGNPVACAAALATLDTYEEEGLLTRGAELAPLLGGRAAFAEGPAARHRHPQSRPDRRDRARADRRQADQARLHGLPQGLRERAADPHHRRHHRHVAAADHREVGDRPALRHRSRRPEDAARLRGKASLPCTTIQNAIGGASVTVAPRGGRAGLQSGDRRAVGDAAALDRGRGRTPPSPPPSRRSRPGPTTPPLKRARSCSTSRSCSTRTPTRSPRRSRAEHGKTHADAVGEVAARHRGGRVRLRHPASAEGRVLPQCRPGDRHAIPTASRSASSPASRRSTSRPWCRCGCIRWRSPAATPSS